MISHWNLRLLASAVAMLTVTQPHHAAAAPSAAPSSADLTQLEHISIRSIGKGSPVVLIPGLSSPRAVWDGVAPALAKSHRVLLVQINGFGGDAPRANTSPGILDGAVAELDGYLARNRLTGAAVVGHSLGGLVGLMLAKAHPGDVGKLMMVDSLPYVGVIFAPNATVAAITPQAAMLRDRMGAAAPSAAAAQATAAGLARTPAAQALVARWVAAADPKAGAQAMYEDLTTDLRPAVASVAIPITEVHPVDNTRPAEQTATFYRTQFAGAPHVDFIPVADSGHFIMLDQPSAFAAALDRFLQS